MPSFDVVIEADMIEVRNAVDQANKEISIRFDFKGSDARIEQKELAVTIVADDEFKVNQVKDVLHNKLSKRNVDLRFLDYTKQEKISGDKIKQHAVIRKGIAGDLAKRVVKQIKDSKLKVQASIQGDTLRVSGAKRDTLQDVIALLKKEVNDIPISFNNFRD